MKIEKEDEVPKLANKKRLLIILALLAIVILGVLVFSTRRVVYQRSPDDAIVTFLASVYPFPAVKVGSMSISMKDYLIEHRVLKSSFDSIQDQEPPAPDQLQELILQTLINKRVIAKFAKDYNVVVSNEHVEEYYKQSIAGEESEEGVAQELQDTFGWTIADFKKRVIEPIVLALDTNKAIVSNELVQSERRTLIDSANQRVKQGEDFTIVAKETMEPLGLTENDLGFFKVSALPDEWRDIIDARAQGEITEVLESDSVFVFFLVSERIVAGEDTQVHLMSVTVPKKSLEDLVREYIANVEIKRYIGT